MKAASSSLKKFGKGEGVSSRIGNISSKCCRN